MTRHLGRIFKRGEVPGSGNGKIARARDALRQFLMRIERANLFVFTRKDQGRHRDLRQPLAAVGPADADLNLRAKPIGTERFSHGHHQIQHGLVGHMARPDRATPATQHIALHARLPRLLHLVAPSRHIMGRHRPPCRVDQRQPRDPMGRLRHHFQRHDPAQRKAQQGKPLGRLRQDPLRQHGRAAYPAHIHNHGLWQLQPLEQRREHAFVAGRAGQQQERQVLCRSRLGKTKGRGLVHRTNSIIVRALLGIMHGSSGRPRFRRINHSGKNSGKN